LFLKKKLVVIPQHLQYEQYCNAAAFKKLGVMVVEKADKNFDEHLKIWLEEGKHIPVDFPDNAGDIVREVVEFFLDRVEKKNEAATPLK
ncbi:MAG TPA: hypothetical protein VJ246_02640, partial [Patescibacteria group bacterium]|nr:hypothetical protein [Patescibacteria group bacterium]